MLKKIFLLLLLPSYLFGQNISNSVGVVSLNQKVYNNSDGLIQFFNEDGSVWYEFNFYYDDSDGKWDYPNDDFDVLAFHPDYFLLKVRCISVSSEVYKVVVNEMFEDMKLIKKSPKYKFETWPEYILNSSHLDFDVLSNPILNEVDGEVLEGWDASGIQLEPVEINEHWLKLKWLDHGGTNYGWIRWRDGSSMLVEPIAID